MVLEFLADQAETSELCKGHCRTSRGGSVPHKTQFFKLT